MKVLIIVAIFREGTCAAHKSYGGQDKNRGETKSIPTPSLNILTFDWQKLRRIYCPLLNNSVLPKG